MAFLWLEWLTWAYMGAYCANLANLVSRQISTLLSSLLYSHVFFTFFSLIRSFWHLTSYDSDSDRITPFYFSNYPLSFENCKVAALNSVLRKSHPPQTQKSSTFALVHCTFQHLNIHSDNIIAHNAIDSQALAT